ncbi:MAG: GrpB family protein [Parcubacteria group bacterium]|nr:GrpB family protein [Parcubacteria group bacterium]
MKKFKIYPSNLNFPEIFEEKKKKIFKIIEGCDIHHIGSTAVLGLGGKGIIDMMIGINDWKEAEEIVEKLKSIGFTHVNPKENERIFLSTQKDTGIGDFHIHIVKKGGNIYSDILAFRDYLRENKKEVSNFYKLKIKWHTDSNGDRKMYGKLKGEYIKEILLR